MISNLFTIYKSISWQVIKIKLKKKTNNNNCLAKPKLQGVVHKMILKQRERIHALPLPRERRVSFI